MAQFHPQEGDRIPPCGEPMTRVATTVLSDRVHEHLLFVRYCLYMLHTFCLTPCFFMAFIISDGFMLSKAPFMSKRVVMTNSLLCVLSVYSCVRHCDSTNTSLFAHAF
jgi:hypothetical protein